MNFSAHRFLADTYSTMPGHQIARVSEVLQMQLWQPTNITLLQPQLSQTNLGILQTSGISSASFREFNPLFMRDGAYFQTSGLVASNNTYSDDVVATWQHKKIGLSFGQFHSQSDGFRENADYETNIYDALAQVNLSPQTSIQTEYRRVDDGRGETTLTREPDLNKRNIETSDTWRFGTRHLFSLKSGMISNFTHSSSKNQSESFNTIYGNQSFSAELQHVFRLKMVQLISGFSYYSSEQNFKNLLFSFENNKENIENTSLYIYANSEILDRLYFTTGISFDLNKNNSNSFNKKLVNPKFGLTWLPNENTTLRLAAFKSLKSEFINNQTIQPTQVAGFNQFFDEWSNAEVWRYGAGVDHILNNNIRIGYEWSMRQVKYPIYVDPSVIQDSMTEDDYFEYENYFERSYRAYFDTVINKNISAHIDYINTNSDNPRYEAIPLSTHKIPFGVSFFSSHGYSININPTLYYQNGTYDYYYNPKNKKSDFLNLDLDIRYRLPNRHGQLVIGFFNILNKKFYLTDYDFYKTSIFPERILYTGITLSFQ
jgi:hypothetical protein